LLIAYTPLKTYVPGYPDIDQRKELYKLNLLADSLMQDIKQKNIYIENIKRIINNQEIVENESAGNINAGSINYDTIKNNISADDSLFRVEFENQTKYNLYVDELDEIEASKTNSLQNLNFFKPANGIITAKFNIQERHYGIDIATSHNEAVKSVLDGTVILSDWTLETGNVLVIDHGKNLISVYKHNATLLKQEGDIVKAGEPVAIAGESGKQSTGPHLHFELWDGGKPVDPLKYIVFN
jgi:murein DD-endopeptidase MepM/ murein hydrolase activator NlpD